MVQPLNKSTNTANNHPEWRNTSLRLNEQEKGNPHLVLKSFFQCYRLHIVREIMWGWTVTVVSSPNSISADPHERNNHIFFYEKIEQLIEACWMLQNKDQLT